MGTEEVSLPVQQAINCLIRYVTLSTFIHTHAHLCDGSRSLFVRRQPVYQFTSTAGNNEPFKVHERQNLHNKQDARPTVRWNIGFFCCCFCFVLTLLTANDLSSKCLSLYTFLGFLHSLTDVDANTLILKIRVSTFTLL